MARWLVAGLLSLVPLRTHATVKPGPDQRQQAAELANQGFKAFKRGNFDSAELNFARAFQMARVPSIGLWYARSLREQGKLVEAADLYRQVIAADVSAFANHKQKIHRDAKRDAVIEQAEVEARIPRLLVRFEDSVVMGVVVLVDGKPIELGQGQREASVPVNPGDHRVVTWPGQPHETVQIVEQVQEGERRVVLLAPQLRTSDPDSVKLSKQETERLARDAENRHREHLRRTEQKAKAEAERMRRRYEQVQDQVYWGKKRAWGWVTISMSIATAVPAIVLGAQFRTQEGNSWGTPVLLGGIGVGVLGTAGGLVVMNVDMRSDHEGSARLVQPTLFRLGGHF